MTTTDKTPPPPTGPRSPLFAPGRNPLVLAAVGLAAGMLLAALASPKLTDTVAVLVAAWVVVLVAVRVFKRSGAE